SDPANCLAEYDKAKIREISHPSFFIERSDRDQWAWPFAVRKTQYSADSLVKDVIAGEAPKISCIYTDSLQLLRHGIPLDPEVTLSQAGVLNGDVLQLLDRKPASNRYKVGFNELDVAPETRHMYGWDSACATGPIALDYRARSLGIEVNIPDTQMVDS